MEIKSVVDDEFRKFGEVITGYDFSGLVEALKSETPVPETGVTYVPDDPKLEALPIFQELQDGVFGGMPIEIGYCNGTNTKLNCLEYHRGSEVNVAADDIVLLLAQRSDLSPEFQIDTDKVAAFRVPAGCAVLLYETSLHYAPARSDGSFRVAIVLPRDTNTEKPGLTDRNAEDRLLWARNKWLIAHADADEAKQGAYVGIEGPNIDIA